MTTVSPTTVSSTPARETATSPEPGARMALVDSLGALTIPDYAGDAQALSVNTAFDAADLKLPQLKLCQDTTPQRKRSSANFIPDLNEGDFFNDATGVNYGQGPLRFLVLKAWTSFMVLKPFDEGGGIVCRGTLYPDGIVRDPVSERVLVTEWGPNGEAPECTRFLNYLFYLPETRETVWFTASKTFLGPFRQFNASLRAGKLSTWPDFSKIFTLRSITTPRKGAPGDYYIPAVSRQPVGLVTHSDPMFEMLKHEALRLKDTKVDESSAAEETDHASVPTAGVVDGVALPY